MRFSSVKWSSTLNGLHTSYSLKSPTASAPLRSKRKIPGEFPLLRSALATAQTAILSLLISRHFFSLFNDRG